ncbi:hypothetical protein GCM10007276_22450 [Agaricicola taiwanensis]|uniref:YjiS-like domain-containing protein n=1 Tax=Agaricicola taiwanensis TaxID=591372 RepID=A0A8J2YIA0_9RHOB|nr:DUF1127 domain-containing protein [Agaricicola taiwanensis]GGE44837.1 hypothetical protein GCM10007276_22450 [Agaricicola taiwanensis]
MLIWAFLARRLRQWKAYRETVSELARLDDRSLADMNIHRSEIGFIASRAAKEQAA